MVTRGLVVHDEAGRPLRMAGSNLDITERMALHARFLQAQKLDLLGRLSAGAAHDINNLLSVIVSCSDLLRMELPTGAARDDVEEISRAGLQASGIVRQLLAFGRQQPLENQVLDLNAVLAALERVLTLFAGPGVTLTIRRDPALGRIRCDSARVEQMILNLCANARDAMPHGGRITIETANVDLAPGAPGLRGPVTPGRYVRLSVQDTGSGMSAEVRSRLFEPFFTTKESGKGTGLGLTTVQGIMEAASGHVGVESEVARGSTFSLYFPQVDGLPAAPGEGPRG